MTDALEEIPIPTPVPVTGYPDAQDWLHMMVRMLLQRQPILDERYRYFTGAHRLPEGAPQYMQGALKKLRRLATTNYIGLITTAPVERMYVRGFRFGDVGEADKDAQQIWSYNDMDMQQTFLHTSAAVTGFGYTMVTPPDPGEKYPRITVEDPRQCFVYHDPLRPNKRVAGLRMWIDDLSGRALAILYRPEGAYGWVGPQGVQLANLTIQDLINRLLGLGMAGAGGFQLTGFIPNPPGFTDIPLVEYVWRPGSGDFPWGEADYNIQVIQDRLNQTVYDRIAISYFQAYRQRYGTGISVNSGGRKNPSGEPPFKPGVNMLWAVENPDAEFGEFSTADVTQILEAIREDISQIASISKTPAHYLMGKMANISGETLTQAETGLVSKTQIRMMPMGWSHIQTIKMCFTMMGDSRGDDFDAATLWVPPGKELTSDLALAGQQWSAIGIPLELIMERQGFDPDEIAFAVAKKKEADQQAQDQQLTMMKAQASLAPSPVAGKPPASQPGVNKKSKAAKNPTAGTGGPTKKKPTS